MSDYEPSIEERLKKHPTLKNRIESLLDIVENSSGCPEKADDAERCVVNEMRRMGNEALHDRALSREISASENLRKNYEDIIGHGKKSLLVHDVRHNSCL
jgi:hypothetical protein